MAEKILVINPNSTEAVTQGINRRTGELCLEETKLNAAIAENLAKVTL